MPQFKRLQPQRKHINLATKYLIFQRLAGMLFGAAHAVVAAQCTCPNQSLHETHGATGLSRNTVDIILHDFARAGLGTYRSRLFSPADDTLLEVFVNGISRGDRLGSKKA